MTGSDIKKTFALTCPKCGNDKFVQSGDENAKSKISCPACGAAFVAGDRAKDQARQEAQKIAHDLVTSRLSGMFKNLEKK